jgi:hypothetical protein
MISLNFWKFYVSVDVLVNYVFVKCYGFWYIVKSSFFIKIAVTMGCGAVSSG